MVKNGEKPIANQVFDCTISGINSVLNSLSPLTINPDTGESEEWELDAIVQNFKSFPNNIASIPGNLSTVYREGTLEQKVEQSVAVVGTVFSIVKGKPSKSMNSGVALAGFNPKTRMLNFIMGAKEAAIPMNVRVPDGFNITKLKSYKQSVFTNGKTFITLDKTSHVGDVWKMFDSQIKVGSTLKKDRMGTFDESLNWIAE